LAHELGHVLPRQMEHVRSTSIGVRVVFPVAFFEAIKRNQELLIT